MREMKKTCKYILSVIACNVVLSLTAIAAEISWKGGGGTSAWSDGTNDWAGDHIGTDGIITVTE